MVQVASHSRHRQHVSTVMTFASVSKILPLHCGHSVGRATVVADCGSGITSGIPPAAATHRANRSSMPSYPSSSTLASQKARTNAITMTTVEARFWLARLRFSPVAVHCAHCRSDAALASSDTVACVVINAIVSDYPAQVCSLVHRGRSSQAAAFGCRNVGHLRLLESEQPGLIVSHTIRVCPADHRDARGLGQADQNEPGYVFHYEGWCTNGAAFSSSCWSASNRLRSRAEVSSARRTTSFTGFTRCA